jgi:hypothetical protein
MGILTFGNTNFSKNPICQSPPLSLKREKKNLASWGAFCLTSLAGKEFSKKIIVKLSPILAYTNDRAMNCMDMVGLY